MAQGQIVIAEQNFNSLSDAGTACSDMLSNGGFLTNSGASNVGTGLSDFESRWFVNANSGSSTVGPVTATNDSGDFIGVNSFSGSNAPNTSPDGTSVASGTEHNFEFNDVDGIVVTAFESVDVSGVSNRRLRFYYWVNGTGYETDDQFKATILGQSGTGTAIVNVTGDDLEITTGTWIEVDIDLEPIIAVQGENLLLQFEVSNNSSSENIFVDDIQFYYEEDVMMFMPYCETFDLPGKGLEGPCPEGCEVEDFDGVDWTITSDGIPSLFSSTDYFITMNGVLEAQDVNEELCWVSPMIDISSSPVAEFSVDITEIGDIESNDYVDVILIVDGMEMMIPNFNGLGSADHTLTGDNPDDNDFGSVTVTASGITGSMLQIKICIDKDGGSEQIQIDNVKVNEELPDQCAITSVTVIDEGTCNDVETPYVNDDEAYITVEVCFENIPEGGNLVVEVGEEQASISVDEIFSSEEDCAELMLTIPADGQPYMVDAYFDADLLCNGMGSGVAPESCSFLTPCDYLFFSEYIEGSGNNKCLEIYNPTDFDVDLSSFGVFLSFNGGSFETTVPLSGIVASGDVFVICNSNATSEFLALADATSTQINFNGDDAVLLEDANGVIDAIGQRGFDPGSEWNSNGVGTRDETLQRMFWVQNGDNNPNDAFDPSAEWMSLPQNTSFGLGYHGSPCQPSLPPGTNPVGIGGCGDVNLDISDTDFDITTTCTPQNFFQDKEVFVFQEACGESSSVTSDVSVSPGGYAGLSYRASLVNNSARVSIYVKGNNRVYWSVRSSTGGFAITNSTFAFSIKSLRIVRTGNLYRGYVSSNGVNFALRFQAVVNLGDCPLAGAYTHSYVSTVPVTGTFANLIVSSGYTFQTGGEEAELVEADLAISPNPATDWLSVAWPTNYSGPGQLEIRDLNGRLLQNEKVNLENGSQHLFLANDMPAGIYLLSLHTENEIMTKRFIKAE